MFGKSSKKATIDFYHRGDGYSGSSTSFPLNEGQLLDYLKGNLDVHGKLVIEHISSENEIRLTTSGTLEHAGREGRIEEMSDVIRSYIKGRAIPMEAHAVFAEGVLKGVFGNESHAHLKRKNLISKGFAEKSIEIKPIEVDSFKDCE